MKLDNKGFAITSIIYSILILFLALVVLILNNMAVRQNIFERQKQEILEKLENVGKICIAAKASAHGNVPTGEYNYGDEYICSVNDITSFHFYVLEDGDDANLEEKTARTGEISLIMDQSLEQKSAWCLSNNPCEADGAKSVLAQSTTSWTNIVSNKINLPTKSQVDLLRTGIKSEWFNQNSCWTSTPVDDKPGYAWRCGGYAITYGVSDDIHPVITINKSQISG